MAPNFSSICLRWFYVAMVKKTSFCWSTDLLHPFDQSLDLRRMDPFCQKQEESAKLREFDEEEDEYHPVQQKPNSPPESTNPTDADDFSDVMISFTDEEDNSEEVRSAMMPPEQPRSTEDNVTRILQDFEEFENTTLPPIEIPSTQVQNVVDWDFAGIFQTSDTMTGAREQDIGDCGETLNVSYGDGGSGDARHVNVTTHGSVDGGSGVGCMDQVCVSSFMKYEYSVSLGMYVWRHVGGNEMAKRPRRVRKKRKYRGVRETPDQSTIRMERHKILNRDAAARAYEKRQAYEAQLQQQIDELRKQNEFLQRLLVFLEGDPSTDLPPKPLRRTISGPI
ncbi:hypothetical protein RJ639_013373 [Escallonia herrerae]|uniref:BZIP domain-containing protein n=1 Tax=Escallonia herrerae TaxID=1293975 RepID=A0AA88VG11_9ASTE|nr:hypothetical protein RJ639_013373 [Escallonia herrerae]